MQNYHATRNLLYHLTCHAVVVTFIRHSGWIVHGRACRPMLLAGILHAYRRRFAERPDSLPSSHACPPPPFPCQLVLLACVVDVNSPGIAQTVLTLPFSTTSQSVNLPRFAPPPPTLPPTSQARPPFSDFRHRDSVHDLLRDLACRAAAAAAHQDRCQ